jgi:uncharacterized protein YbjT (DUF2867 family)
MNVAVIGGTGLIGSQVVHLLNAEGHHAVPHSPSTGVDLLTGDGLIPALDGADVVVNLSNSPTFDEAAHAFFRTSMDNLLAAATTAGVRHVVILSIVGVDRVPDDAYYQAKVLQEKLLVAGPVPYSIVRATQFDEFLHQRIDRVPNDVDPVRLPAMKVQPIASADVARAVADVAVGTPLNATRNIAGPDVFTLVQLGRITLAANGDARTVATDEPVPGDDARILHDEDDGIIASTTYRQWLASL